MKNNIKLKKVFLDQACKIQGWLQDRYYSMFGVRPLVESCEDIHKWFDSPFGQKLFHHQSQKLNEILPKIFGYHLMQLSILGGKSLFQESPVTHCFKVLPGASLLSDDVEKNTLVSEFEKLPVESDSIDAVLLHHALEYSSNPHQLLREVARTTIPNGHVIIVGFNRWSILSLTNYLACFLSSSAFYKYQRVSTGRLKDWCKVLELEPVYMDYGYHTLPLQRHDWPRLDNLLARVLPFFGQYYILVARKNVNAMANIQFEWKKNSVLPQWGKGVARPSASQVNCSLTKKDMVDDCE